jgi:hypothetical protein
MGDEVDARDIFVGVQFVKDSAQLGRVAFDGANDAWIAPVSGGKAVGLEASSEQSHEQRVAAEAVGEDDRFVERRH